MGKNSIKASLESGNIVVRPSDLKNTDEFNRFRTMQLNRSKRNERMHREEMQDAENDARYYKKNNDQTLWLFCLYKIKLLYGSFFCAII